MSFYRTSFRLIGPAILAAALVVGSGTATRAQSDLDDLRRSVDPDKKKTTPVKRQDSGPSGQPGSGTRTGPATQPGTRPKGDYSGPQPRRRAGGLWVSGRRYANLADYLYGIWRWRNPQGHIMHIGFYRNGRFSFLNTANGLRLMGTFRTSGGNVMHMVIYRICRYQTCQNRQPPQRRSFPAKPQTANVLFSANERWSRMRRN